MFKYLLPSLKTSLCVLVLSTVLIVGTANELMAQAISIYASPNGVDTGNGASLTTAVNIKRASLIAKNYPNDAVTIWLTDGIYSTLSLDNTNSRNSTAPVIYQAINRGKAIFQPLTNLNISSFQPIPDSIKSRIIDSNAQKKVLQLPLTSLKLKNMNVWPNTFGHANMTTPKFYNN
jgi:hypothetical protein